MKEVPQRRIRDDERTLLDALRNSGEGSGQTAEEALSRINLLVTQGMQVLDKVSPRAHDALFSDRTLRDNFLEPGSECAAFLMSIDIRRSAELMLKARTAELFGQFMAELCDELRRVICDRFGIVDKFTGDGLLASFPEFFSGPDAGFRAISAAQEAHLAFARKYKLHRRAFSTVLADIGLGIGIDYGAIRFMRIAGDLTVVGAPVVYAARLSSCPAGKTFLNQRAHEKIAGRYGAFCTTSETTLDIKHEGRVLAYEARLTKRIFVPTDPPWLNEGKAAATTPKKGAEASEQADTNPFKKQRYN